MALRLLHSRHRSLDIGAPPPCFLAGVNRHGWNATGRILYAEVKRPGILPPTLIQRRHPTYRGEFGEVLFGLLRRKLTAGHLPILRTDLGVLMSVPYALAESHIYIGPKICDNLKEYHTIW